MSSLMLLDFLSPLQIVGVGEPPQIIIF